MKALTTLGPVLAREIRGQDHLFASILSVIQRGELGLSHPDRPRGSFLLLGPTGVGKTETVLVTVRHLGMRLFRFDMSEFQTQEATTALLHGLGAASREAHEGTILLDEIEKAHPRVLDLLLQLLDTGVVTAEAAGHSPLQKFYVWMTSNIGGPEITGLQHCTRASAERHVLARAEDSLRPELFARVMEKLVFHRLDFDHQLEIAAKFLDRTLLLLARQGHRLQTDSSVLPLLVRKGFHAKLGARPMRDTVERLIGDAVARAILAGTDGSGLLQADPSGEHLILKR